MKSKWMILTMGLLLTVSGSFLWAAEAPLPAQPAGYVLLDHITSNTCLAMRVTVPADQAVSGLRWFNGAASPWFQHVLVASGSGLFPPILQEAVSLADSVQGLQEDWSELTFSEAVGSSSGSLFLIMQYPPDYALVTGITPLSVGYQNVENRSHYFFTDDGLDWIKVGAGCQLMMEPVFCLRDSSMLVKSALRDEGDVEREDLPKTLGVDIYPNPFNPIAKIKLALPQAADCSLKIYDIRGMLVRDFHPGYLEAGYHTFVWEGRDERGHGTSSGVYFAQMKVGDKTLNHRLIMIK